jgi:hypothetical protein
MSFIRHTSRPIRLSCLREGNQAHATDHGAKPDGIWFSVGDGSDWRELVCKRFNTNDVKYRTEIFLNEAAKILWIKNADDLDAFTIKYGYIRPDGQKAIDWANIATQFAGIIISPLCVERCNYEPTYWYACWEVSCGCVWQVKAVRDLRPINY